VFALPAVVVNWGRSAMAVTPSGRWGRAHLIKG
jgi:hypothetical protein